MFNINDDILAAAGYNVTALSDDKKDKYKREITEAVNARVAEQILSRLTEHEALEFEDVNSNPDRTRRWLAEFHPDYAARDEYKDIRGLFDSDEEAMSFYASSLWMRYAVPDYGAIMQDTLNGYVEELATMRRDVNKRLGIA